MATATKTPRKPGGKAKTTTSAARIMERFSPRKPRRKAKRTKARSKATSPVGASVFKRRLLSGSYESDLPFGIHADLQVCAIDEPQFDFDWFDWNDQQRRLADAALRSGCKISIPVSPIHAIYAALRVSQMLKRYVFGAYDPEHERLVLWDTHEDAFEDVCDCCGK